MPQVGSKVHLGFGAKGGAGFIGTFKGLTEDGRAIVETAAKTYKGPVEFLSEMED